MKFLESVKWEIGLSGRVAPTSKVRKTLDTTNRSLPSLRRPKRCNARTTRTEASAAPRALASKVQSIEAAADQHPDRCIVQPHYDRNLCRACGQMEPLW